MVGHNGRMSKLLTARVKGAVEQDLKDWLTGHADKMDRSEGSIVRLALRDYRAKMTRRKDG